MNKNTPRKPNAWEVDDLVGHLLQHQVADSHSDALKIVTDAHIAVFEDYQTCSPGYIGKIMLIAWPGGPEVTETFIWRDGQIKAFRSWL